MKASIFTAAFLALAIFFEGAAAVAKTSREYPTDKINVHIVPHTHDDPGWLKTADQYYYGSNITICQARGVQYILDSVVNELENDPNKHFVYVEMSFFQRWYFEQSNEKRISVKNLVKNGQLSFANGGWVMHDEAGSHFVSMIDQTTLGHRFLKEEFDYLPRVGWQIDPFGHSAIQPSLLGHDLGFDSLFFGRIDYEDRAIRKDNKQLEFIWQAEKSNPDSKLLTGVFSDGNYGYPGGFCFDMYCDGDQPVMDDPKLEDYNVPDIMQRFADAILQEAAWSAGNHIMLKMGSDFHYAAAGMWYKNLDKLIKIMNENDSRFNLFYSDPTTYTDARAAEGLSWTVKNDDFFPYADCEHCYWGGYFTSRPTLKYLERLGSSFLQVQKQFSTFSSFDHDALFKMTAAVGLVNHHDAITGTAKQHVTDDYIKILDKAFTATEKVVSEKLSEMVFSSENPVSNLQTCRLASNESSCAITESAQVGDNWIITVYNGLPRSQTKQVTVYLPQLSLNSIAVTVEEVLSSGELHSISSEILVTAPKNGLVVAPLSLVFTAESVAALFFSRFLVKITPLASVKKGLMIAELRTPVRSRSAGVLTISSDKVSVNFDEGTGLMTGVTRLDKGISAKVTNDMYYYIGYGSPGIKGRKYSEKDDRTPYEKRREPPKSAVGGQSSQPSGAYIFRPADESGYSGAKSIRGINPVILNVVEGESVTEVHQQFSDWASQIVRVRDGSDAVEVEWTVGPIPVESDLLGKEIISRFDSGLDSELYVYTDANGREFQERLKNYRPTWDLRGGAGESEQVAGNYYPITAAAYIKDKNLGVQLSVLSDRSESMASLQNGQLEFMVHRRLTKDDNRGVGEALNETTGGMEPYPSWKRQGVGITVSGKLYLLLSDLNDGMMETRTMMDQVFQNFKVFYSRTSLPLPQLQVTPPLGLELPLNCQLLTLETWAQNILLLRLAHQFAVGEDVKLSVPLQIDVGALLQKYNPSRMEEMSLSVNQLKSTMAANRIQWPVAANAHALVNEFAPSTTSGFITTLNPMEVKTFLVYLKP